MDRYNRHIILDEIGQQGQDKLLKAKVLVIGAGGLGCPVLQYLAAAGVGVIGIVDFDIVEESNLQRQILFGSSSLGQNKAIAAKERLEDLNSMISIRAYPEPLTAKNALSLFKDYDLIIDGTDNFATRYLINDAAVITNKPLIYGAIYKFEGQVSVFNYKNGPSYRCLFPEPPEKGTVPNCSEIGVLGVLPGIIGCMQANEGIKIILGFDDVLSGKLYCYDAKTIRTSMLTISKSESIFEEIIARKNNFENLYKLENCERFDKEISISEALQKKHIQFIDVRMPDELPKIKAVDTLRIPLNELEKQLSKIDNTKETIFFCQSGIRSKKAVLIFQKNNIINSYSLKNGVNTLVDYFKTTVL